MFYNSEKKRLTGRGCTIILLLVVVILAFVIGSLAYTPVQRGRIGVIVRFGKVQPGILHPGLHWRVPFIDSLLKYRTEKIVYEASYTPEQSQADYKDFCIDTSSSDGQQVTICYTVRFSIIPEKTEWIANIFWDEGRIVERVVKTDSRSWARAITRNYTAEQLYSGNIIVVQTAIAEELAPIFGQNGVNLDEFVIREVHFSEDYIKAVEAKQIAEQTVTTRKHEAEQAEYEATRAVNLAQGAADARRIQAQAEADAIRLQGEALKAFPEILQWQFIQSFTSEKSRITWGILPPGMNLFPFLQVPTQTQP